MIKLGNIKIPSWLPNRRYITVGLCVYAIELLAILEAQHLGASSVVAVAISFWLGLVVSFGLQKVITFKDKRMHHKVLIPQIVVFSLLVIFNFCFTILVTKLISPPVPAVVSRTIALAVTTFWNFYLYKTRIFNQPFMD